MRKSRKYAIILLAILVIFLGGFFALISLRSGTTRIVQNNENASDTSPWNNPDASGVFISRDLGIAFEYGPGAEIEATGTKVYVFEKGSEPASGQSVEIFKKEPDESFEDSIRRQILDGYSAADCRVEIEQTNKYEGGYMTAEIIPPPSAPLQQPASANAAECNGAYAKTNGLRYFLYDTNHPAIFAFFDIGQSAILSGEGQEPWQDTLRFVP